jgi:hypothetical protein
MEKSLRNQLSLHPTSRLTEQSILNTLDYGALQQILAQNWTASLVYDYSHHKQQMPTIIRAVLESVQTSQFVLAKLN